MTVEEFLVAASGRKNLNPMEHFVRVKKRRELEETNYFVPHRTDLIENYVWWQLLLFFVWLFGIWWAFAYVYGHEGNINERRSAIFCLIWIFKGNLLGTLCLFSLGLSWSVYKCVYGRFSHMHAILQILMFSYQILHKCCFSIVGNSWSSWDLRQDPVPGGVVSLLTWPHVGLQCGGRAHWEFWAAGWTLLLHLQGGRQIHCHAKWCVM